MNKNINILLTTLCLIFLAACTQTEEWGTTADGTGIRVTLTDGVTDIETRATPEELRKLAGKNFIRNFHLSIIHRETKEERFNAQYQEGTITLTAGFYDITATYGKNPVLELDAPYYEGTTENVEVKAKGTTEVTIPCRVANALVSVCYENLDKINATYSNYYVEVGIEGREDTVHIADTKKSAYFQAGSTPKLTFVGQRQNSSESISIPLTDDALQAGEHLILTLRMSPEMTMDITTQVENVTVAETIPQEWLPKPKVEAVGFTNNELSMYESETPTAKFNLNLAAPLQELKFTLKFQDAIYQSLNKDYTLSELTEDDKTALTNAGIILPAIGSQNAVFDFSGLAAKLTGQEDATLDNVIILKEVKANGRLAEIGDSIYTIHTSAPDFDIQVYPGRTWTMQFEINSEITHGNASAIRQNMTYEYRLPDGKWTTSTDSIITQLTPGTAYQVRGKFGEHYTDIVNVTTFPQTPLENGNLNEYSIVRGEDGNLLKGHGAQFEWTAWTTLNETTTPNCPLTAYNYNSRSGTRPVSDIRPGANDNTAVWIVTIGYGYGGTLLGPNKVTPSELIYDKTYETGTHPTAVHFWYKYAPFKEDKSDISITVYSNEQIVGNAILQETQTISSYSQGGYTLAINYDSNYLELTPNRIELIFRSGFNESTESRESGSGSANPKFRGSELTVDDISLVYDR